MEALQQLTLTHLIMGFTTLISIWAFNDAQVKAKLMHWPYQEARNGEHYRWLTSGLIHGDVFHLLFNMLTLYFFGPLVETMLKIHFPLLPSTTYLIFYLLAIVAASSATYMRYKDSPSFASIGASGATSAILFAGILFLPTMQVGLLIIPFVRAPAFLFGILYLWYSSYAARQGRDNIDHVAHYYGALFGFIFPAVFKPSLLTDFLRQIMDMFQ
jgi:membrane associated rhomboid family serine protease